MNDILLSTVLVTMLCMGIVLVLSVVFSLSFTRRIDRLIQQMRQVSHGEFSVDATATSGDEIGQLQAAFTKMVKRLDVLVNDVYQSQITQKDLRIRALQAQINPHFLYNCLDNLNWHAIMNGSDRAQRIITQLSQFYRTSLNNGRGIGTVRNEIDNIRCYIGLQLDMHNGSFDVEFHVPDELEEYLTVSLVLQPIVENAINHGIDQLPDETRGRLVITASRDGDDLVFCVSNNGPPIDGRLAQQVLTQKKKGYGMSNVNDRIKLVFGEGYGIHFQPTGEGTDCLLRIPAVTEIGGSFVE